MSIVTYYDLDTPVFEIDFLRYLFTDGAQGSFWGPLPYYSDAAGTVEADWGDPVGNIPNASGDEPGWTQVTSTARPILGRVPVGGRRNLLRWTEDFSNPQWGASLGVVTPLGNGEFLMAGDVGADGTNWLAYPIVSGSSIEQPRAISILVKSAGERYVAITALSSWVANPTFCAVFDLVEGVVTSAHSFFNIDNRIELQEDGFYRVSCRVDRNSAGYNYFRVGCSADGTIGGVASYEGDGVSGFIVRHPQFDQNVEPTPYQRVGNEFDITEAGVKEVHYLRFDGTDDQVTTTLPAISGGTIVLAGTNGIWIDSLDFAGGEFSVGPGTYTGGPADLLPILGDILVGGGFVIDRALTPEEIAQVKGYYVARGASGLFQWGEELVGDPEFDDPSYWSVSGDGSEVSGGAARFINSISINDLILKSNILEVGSYYKCELEITDLTPGGVILIAVGQGGAGARDRTTSSIGAFVTYADYRVAANLNRYLISPWNASPESPISAQIDRISLKKLILATPNFLLSEDGVATTTEGGGALLIEDDI